MGPVGLGSLSAFWNTEVSVESDLYRFNIGKHLGLYTLVQIVVKSATQRVQKRGSTPYVLVLV